MAAADKRGCIYSEGRIYMIFFHFENVLKLIFVLQNTFFFIILVFMLNSFCSLGCQILPSFIFTDYVVGYQENKICIWNHT